MGRRPRASWRASKWIAAIGLGMLLPAMFGTSMLVRPHARAESIGTTAWPKVRPNARRRGAADGADIHVVFTTSCNQYQRWQAEMVAHTG